MGLLLGELSRHAEACPAGILQGVTKLNLGRNKIGDKGIAKIANTLRTNTTISGLYVFHCDISDIGVQSLAEAIAANGSIRLEELNISHNNIGDIGIAHIATALQMNTTIKSFGMVCGEISDKGAESIAKALAVSMSLKHLNFSDGIISDTGAAHISTALRINNSLELLVIGNRFDTTDAAVLSLVDALKTNTSLKDIRLEWSSVHPDYTLKLMAEIFKRTSLKKITLCMRKFHSPFVSSGVEELKEWLHHVEVRGKELILSMEDNRHLETLNLEFNAVINFFVKSLSALTLETRTALESAVASVNRARSKKSYCALNFSFIPSLNEKRYCALNFSSI